jgi:hypothetical protein
LPTPFLITRGRKVRKDKGGRAHSKFSAKNAWSPIQEHHGRDVCAD